MAEAFVKTFKRDYVVFGNLNSAYDVMQQLPAWFEDYNEISKTIFKSCKWVLDGPVYWGQFQVTVKSDFESLHGTGE